MTDPTPNHPTFTRADGTQIRFYQPDHWVWRIPGEPTLAERYPYQIDHEADRWATNGYSGCGPAKAFRRLVAEFALTDVERDALDRMRRDGINRSFLEPAADTPKGKQDFDGTIDGVGYKQSMDDPHKLPLSLVPPELVEQAARVMGFGMKKYARGQWMRGMNWSSPLDALKRHVAAWERGEEIDADSNLPHLAHAAACISFLLHFTVGPRADEYLKFDDRLFRGPVDL